MIASRGKGRNFDCVTCPSRTQKLRQCDVDKWDFTADDNPSVFPIQIFEGGSYYGFCPAKATWPGNDSVIGKFKTLLYAASTNNLLVQGGINDQPSWFIETMSWFKPMYDQVIFMSKVRSVLGGGKIKKTSPMTQKGRSHGNRRLYR